jgi:hypothetical protein
MQTRQVLWSKLQESHSTWSAAYGVGTVFELTPAVAGRGAETILPSFNNNGTDGYLPVAGLSLLKSARTAA